MRVTHSYLRAIVDELRAHSTDDLRTREVLKDILDLVSTARYNRMMPFREAANVDGNCPMRNCEDAFPSKPRAWCSVMENIAMLCDTDASTRPD